MATPSEILYNRLHTEIADFLAGRRPAMPGMPSTPTERAVFYRALQDVSETYVYGNNPAAQAAYGQYFGSIDGATGRLKVFKDGKWEFASPQVRPGLDREGNGTIDFIHSNVNNKYAFNVAAAVGNVQDVLLAGRRPTPRDAFIDQHDYSLDSAKPIVDKINLGRSYTGAATGYGSADLPTLRGDAAERARISALTPEQRAIEQVASKQYASRIGDVTAILIAEHRAHPNETDAQLQRRLFEQSQKLAEQGKGQQSQDYQIAGAVLSQEGAIKRDNNRRYGTIDKPVDFVNDAYTRVMGGSASVAPTPAAPTPAVPPAPVTPAAPATPAKPQFETDTPHTGRPTTFTAQSWPTTVAYNEIMNGGFIRDDKDSPQLRASIASIVNANRNIIENGSQAERTALYNRLYDDWHSHKGNFNGLDSAYAIDVLMRGREIKNAQEAGLTSIPGFKNQAEYNTFSDAATAWVEAHRPGSSPSGQRDGQEGAGAGTRRGQGGASPRTYNFTDENGEKVYHIQSGGDWLTRIAGAQTDLMAVVKEALPNSSERDQKLALALIIGRRSDIENADKLALGQKIVLPTADEVRAGLAVMKADGGVLADGKIEYPEEVSRRPIREIIPNLTAPVSTTTAQKTLDQEIAEVRALVQTGVQLDPQKLTTELADVKAAVARGEITDDVRTKVDGMLGALAQGGVTDAATGDLGQTVRDLRVQITPQRA